MQNDLVQKLQEMEQRRVTPSTPQPSNAHEVAEPLLTYEALMDEDSLISSVEESDKLRYEFVTGPAGSGKCLGIDTPVMLCSGRIVPVQSVETGMQLMGPDSKPRTVLSTNSGHGPLWRITPVKGMPWVCNDVHILTLMGTNEKEGQIIDVPLNEALGFRRGFIPDKNWKLFRVPVDFEEQEVPIHPYIAGAWLGDGTVGTSYLSLGIAKEPIIEKLSKIHTDSVVSSWVPKNNYYRVRLSGARETLNHYLTDGNKGREVPYCYLTNSREIRAEFLAGILDTDGALTGSNGIDLTTKHKDVADAVAFLCRSLGFSAYITTKTVQLKGWREPRDYYRLSISGDLERLPCVRLKPKPRKQVKDVLRTGWKAEPIGQGRYYGFTLDGDGRFLLGDFTVTHNTYTVRQRPNTILTATTGIAAVNLGEGTRTINSLLGFFDLRSLRESIANGRIFRSFYKMASLYPNAKEVVTDEASMLSGEMTDLLFDVFDRSGNGMRWTLVGDFAQLPPVGERGFPAKWAFESSRWKDLSVTKLTKIWRQSDPDYLTGLNCARVGDGQGFVDALGSRLKFVDSLPEDNPGSVIMARNESVDDYNFRKMRELPGDAVSFDNVTWGKPLSEWKNIPPRINLKVGAKVMTLSNSRLGGYVNGSIGHVERLSTNSIIVRLLNGSLISVAQVTDYNRCAEGTKWRVMAADARSVLSQGECRFKEPEKGKDEEGFHYQGTITRWPIRLAWATTNHKVQGLTLDTATICLRNHLGKVETFFQSENMAYVALSRTTTCEGMSIVGTPTELIKAIHVSEKARKAGLL